MTYDSLNTEYAVNNMAITYSRGFYNGWLNGVADQELVDGTYGSNRGLYIGEVIHSSNKLLESGLSLSSFLVMVVLLVLGDQEIGGPVYQVEKMGNTYDLGFSKKFDIGKIKNGWKVYLSSRDKLYKELKSLIQIKMY